MPVTCEVCPHHLFLSEKDIDIIGISKSKVKPPLCSLEDQQALWDNLDVIDIFATDHGKVFFMNFVNFFLRSCMYVWIKVTKKKSLRTQDVLNHRRTTIQR